MPQSRQVGQGYCYKTFSLRLTPKGGGPGGRRRFRLKKRGNHGIYAELRPLSVLFRGYIPRFKAILFFRTLSLFCPELNGCRVEKPYRVDKRIYIGFKPEAELGAVFERADIHSLRICSALPTGPIHLKV